MSNVWDIVWRRGQRGPSTRERAISVPLNPLFDHQTFGILAFCPERIRLCGYFFQDRATSALQKLAKRMPHFLAWLRSRNESGEWLAPEPCLQNTASRGVAPYRSSPSNGTTAFRAGYETCFWLVSSSRICRWISYREMRKGIRLKLHDL